MTEAIVQAGPQEAGPVSRLLSFYALGSKSEAGKLTLAMIEESAKHLKLAPKIDLRLVKTTEMVRVGWLRLVAENESEEVVQQFTARWADAFAGARRDRVTENLGAELARLKEAKAPEPEAEPAALGAEEARKSLDLGLDLGLGEEAEGASFKSPPAQPLAEEDAEEDEEEAEPETVSAQPAVGLALPGVAGEIQDYFLRTAMQPSEMMSVAVGVMVPVVLVSGNVIGPSGPDGCALHLTLVVLAPTNSGKMRAIHVVKDCVGQAGAGALLGPNRFKSGAGLVRWVKENRVSLCVQDEFGRLLAKLGNPRINPCEVEINDRMREFWGMGPNDVYNSPVGAAKGDDSETIKNPRLSILGFGVRDEFFAACQSNDIANGFLNRMAVLEDTKTLRPRIDFTAADAEFPPGLKDKLDKLHLIKPRRLGWTPGAKEIYEAELDRLYSETDERKFKLWGRTPEKIMRTASVFATCRFDKVVERSDTEVARMIMHLSDATFKLGIDDAEEKRQLNHAELKLDIERKARFVLGPSSEPEFRRHFRHNTKNKTAVPDALEDMRGSGIFERKTIATGGREKTIYWLRELGPCPGTLQEALERWEAWKSDQTF